jgi:hypothetical protein
MDQEQSRNVLWRIKVRVSTPEPDQHKGPILDDVEYREIRNDGSIGREKNTSSRRRLVGKKSKLPKAAQLKIPKIDPVEHCKVTREMVLEDRGNIARLKGAVDWLEKKHRRSHC